MNSHQQRNTGRGNDTANAQQNQEQQPQFKVKRIKGGFTLQIPRYYSQLQEIELLDGTVLFLLGANGCGKSSLVHTLFSSKADRNRAKRAANGEMHNPSTRMIESNIQMQLIAAHRELSFENKFPDISYQAKKDIERFQDNYYRANIGRWQNSENKGAIAEFTVANLLNAENTYHRHIAKAALQDKKEEIEERKKKEAPLSIINKLMEQTNIPISLSIDDNGQIIASRTNNKHSYSLPELSDGERAAVLIAADILTAKPNTLFLIDEPERHLHRSISAPLLQALFAQQPDCAFIIATHDLALVQNTKNKQVLIIQDCHYNKSGAFAWDIDTVAEKIPEALQSAVLGARRKILLVEGTEASLDKKLYQLLFPDYAIISAEGCAAVIAGVRGTKQLAEQHRLTVFGIIDNDGRTDEQQQELLQNNIYALPVYAIESLYYCPELLEEIARQQAGGGDYQDLLAAAGDTLSRKLQPHIHALAYTKSLKAIQSILANDPPEAKILDNKEKLGDFILEKTIAITESYQSEKTTLEKALKDKDIATIIGGYPLKLRQWRYDKKMITKAISEVLRCGDDYENYVLDYLKKKPEAVDKIRDTYFQPLIAKMREQEQQPGVRFTMPARL